MYHNMALPKEKSDIPKIKSEPKVQRHINNARLTFQSTKHDTSWIPVPHLPRSSILKDDTLVTQRAMKTLNLSENSAPPPFISLLFILSLVWPSEVPQFSFQNAPLSLRVKIIWNIWFSRRSLLLSSEPTVPNFIFQTTFPTKSFLHFYYFCFLQTMSVDTKWWEKLRRLVLSTTWKIFQADGFHDYH